MFQTSKRPEERRLKRARRYLRRAPATARVIHLPLKTKSRAGVEYLHYKPFLQRMKA